MSGELTQEQPAKPPREWASEAVREASVSSLTLAQFLLNLGSGETAGKAGGACTLFESGEYNA